ncbi:MAG: dienelactone hydrolase family protein [SAR202 cluster bacterium]|nr:dienelactone hydrolase family protein [SAR202 cluster bacterium]
MPAKWIDLKVDGKTMPAYVADPEGPGKRPAVVVIQEVFGVNSNIQDLTNRVANAGYVAIAPDLFWRGGAKRTFGYGQAPDADARAKAVAAFRDDEIVKDINASIDWLRRHPNVGRGGIGITGFCVGGRITYLAAARCPEIAAASVYYGGRIFLPFGEGPSPFDLTSKIKCPVMGNFGELDKNPTPDEVRKIEAALKQHKVPYDFKIYPNADHGFVCDERSSYHAESNRDAWSRTLSWFARHLHPEK